MKKVYDVWTDRWQWKIRNSVYKMIRKNIRTRDDELVQHINCHTKQPAMEVPDLYVHEKHEMSEQIWGRKAQYFFGNKIRLNHQVSLVASMW